MTPTKKLRTKKKPLEKSNIQTRKIFSFVFFLLFQISVSKQMDHTFVVEQTFGRQIHQ